MDRKDEDVKIGAVIRRAKSKGLPFGWFCLAFFCLFYCIQNHNHRFGMADFRVYYSAAQNLLNNKPIYNQAFGQASGLYKYSPVALLAFIPFAVLPYFLAATLYFALLAAFIFMAIKKAQSFADRLEPGAKASAVFPYLLLLIGGAHFYRELHLGNINSILLFFAMLAMELLKRGKNTSPGILLGIIVLFKPHFAIVLAVLLIFKRFKPFTLSIVTIVFGALAPGLYFGFKGDFLVHRQWLLTMVGHNAPDELLKAPNTLQHVVSLFVHNGFPGMNALVTLVAMAVIYCMILFLKKAYPSNFGGNDFSLPYYLCIAVIPVVTLTDTEHFLLAVPVIAYLIANFNRQALGLKLLIVLACILYGGNWFDVWGRTLSDAIERAGVLGIATALIIALALFKWVNRREKIVGAL